ncbi:DNA-protecting protein DprA [Candidatus Micrarchaeota archaeon]|nr:DNA-protecting protein DprA [Candidatus Micrarchaeota archaeon]
MTKKPFDKEEFAKWMKLTLVKGLGPKKLLMLTRLFGSLDNIFDAAPDNLLASGVFTADMLRQWKQLKDASDEKFLNVIDECAKNKIQITTLLDDNYPARLLQTSAPPHTLFLRGDSSLLKAEKTFAIVGGRDVSETAKKFAYDCARGLGDNGFVIVSGGAKGTDTAAHRGALDSKGTKTICVFGTGFFDIYPEENKPLFEEIKYKGLIVSEYLPNFSGSKFSFLQRNRITSGLSDGLLFCASEGLCSGTATQVKIAYNQKIPLFCPAMNLNIPPNIGIQDAIMEYNAKQIRCVPEIMDSLSKHKRIQHASLNNYGV